jgi:metal-responsive CopG/Arc/MetJ family transcriptional regulator
MAKKKKSHARAPGMTQISISLPEDLVEKIDKLAASDNRNRSNFISTYLESLAEEELPKAAEPGDAFDKPRSSRNR